MTAADKTPTKPRRAAGTAPAAITASTAADEAGREVAAPAAAAERRKPRTHPGTRALREMKKLQRSGGRLAQMQPFLRLVREAVQAADDASTVRFQKDAIDTIYAAAERRIVDSLRYMSDLAVHAKRTQVLPQDYLWWREHCASGDEAELRDEIQLFLAPRAAPAIEAGAGTD